MNYKVLRSFSPLYQKKSQIKNSQDYGARALLFYIDPKHPPVYEHMCRSTSNIFLLKEEDREKGVQLLRFFKKSGYHHHF